MARLAIWEGKRQILRQIENLVIEIIAKPSNSIRELPLLWLPVASQPRADGRHQEVTGGAFCEQDMTNHITQHIDTLSLSNIVDMER